MTIKAGDKLPESKLMRLGKGGRPESVAIAELSKGRMALFGRRAPIPASARPRICPV